MNCNNISHILLFLLYFRSNKHSLGEIRDFLKASNNLKLLNCSDTVFVTGSRGKYIYIFFPSQ